MTAIYRLSNFIRPTKFSRGESVKTLNELRDIAFDIAKNHGFADPEPGIPTRLALIHSEVSELLEDYRDGLNPTVTTYKDKHGANHSTQSALEDGRLLKPCGIPSELADIIIRCLDFAGAYGIDIEKAVSEKMQYNMTRPFKHGRQL